MDPADADVVLSRRYDRDSEVPVSVQVVMMVAVASDRRPADLEPLGRQVDTDQLDLLFDPEFLANADTEVSVAFDYEGYTVDVGPDGTVTLLAASP